MSIGNEYSVSDIERSIQSDMGVLVTIPDTPGSFIRFDVKKRGDKAGWCVYYVNEHCVVALYGSWISGQRYEWVNKEKKEITPEIRREVEESRKRRDEEIKAEQNRAAADASALYMALPEASDDFPYLLRKRVHNHDGILRYSEDSDCIVVPLINAEGEIRSLERIFPDGQKRFYPGGEKKGNFCVIGDLEDKAFSYGNTIHVYSSITAEGFFLSHGYRRIRENIVERDGVLIHNWYMEKRKDCGLPQS